jgi:hypothetical protein
MNNNIHLTAVRILSAAALALGCGAVMAQAVQTVTLPLETAKLKPSKLGRLPDRDAEMRHLPFGRLHQPAAAGHDGHAVDR